MNRMFKKGLSWLLVLAMVMTMFAGTTFTASAKTEGTISAETVTAYVLAKDGVTEKQLALWTADAENDTYKDAKGNEIPSVVSVKGYDNYQDGKTQDYILYTGSDNGCFGRNLVVTKYVDVKELASELAKAAGFSYNAESCNVLMQSSVDSWKTTFGSTGSFVVDANKPLYSSFEWLNAVREKSIRSGGSKDININDYNDKREVPSVLAICSWNCRLSMLADDSGVAFSDKETLKDAITALAQKTDMANALRFVSGMDTDVTNGKYLNTGANSAKGVSVITLQPTYNQINITEGTQVENTQAGTDLAYKTGNAIVKTSDNYFTAAEGETVTLDITAEDGYNVSAVAVTDANKTEISVEENTAGYSFKMPGSSVDVTVETAEQPMHNFVLGKCIDSDCGEILDAYKWYYNATGDTYTVSKAEEIEAFADLVNGGISFDGKTVTLAKDITLTGDWNTAIGNKANAFKGTFDGGNKTISGLSITECTGGYKGLFGNNEGTVKNFTISGSIGTADAEITSGTDNIGGAVGYNNGTVTNVNADVAIFVKTSSIYAVGGVVGQNGTKGIISKCSNIADIEGTKCTGGICGRNYNIIDRCYNAGDITGNGGQKDSIGGITGQLGDKNGSYSASVTNCYNTGTISNNNGRWHGGIVGMSDKAGTVLNCYNTGAIKKGYSWNWNPIIGHVDGGNSNPVAENNYSLEELNAGDTTTATQPFTIGTVKTAEELKSADMISLLGQAFCADSGEDSINGGYPVLKWQTGATESALKSIRIDTTDVKTEYYETDKFSLNGVKCYAVYEDGTEELISSAPCTADKTEALTAADTEVVLTYTNDGITGTATVPITVQKNTLQKLEISKLPTKIAYGTGEIFDPEGMKVDITYANNKKETKTVKEGDTLAEGFTVTSTALATDTKTIEVQYTVADKTVSDSFDVYVVDMTNAPKQDTDGTYIIKTAAELSAFSDMVGILGMTDINVVLDKNITVDTNFAPIGKAFEFVKITTQNGRSLYYSKENSYNGTFNGNSKSIELNLTGENNVALFALAGACTIKDLTVTGTVTGTGSGIAGIVAEAKAKANIVNCTNKAAISGGTSVGGIIGNGGTGTSEIVGCNNTGNITGNSHTGGIAGVLDNTGKGIIENCQNSGKIQSTGNYTGGIAGSGTANNCINTGDVEGNENTGGILGERYSADKTVSNCINKGTVIGTDNTGGIFGRSNAGKISDCYNYGNITATGNSIGGIIGYHSARFAALEMSGCYNMGIITVSNEATNVGALIGEGPSLDNSTINDSYFIAGCIKDTDSNPVSNIVGLGSKNEGDIDNSKALSEQELQGEIIKNLSEKIIDLNKELTNAKNMSAEDIAKLEDELKTLKETYEKQLETITGQQDSVIEELKKQLEDLKKQLENLKNSQGSGAATGGVAAADNGLASEKAKAMKELQALLDKSDDYYADEKAELAAAVLAGVRQIENAADKAAAQKALTEAKAKISTIKTKAQIDEENNSEIEKVKNEISQIEVKTNTSKTAKGNIRVKAGADVKDITDMGYTVKYKYYRSVKKSSGYKALKTKDSNTYINTTGKKGTRYYYKVRVYVYDGDKLIGSTALKQSTAGSRKK